MRRARCVRTGALRCRCLRRNAVAAAEQRHVRGFGGRGRACASHMPAPLAPARLSERSAPRIAPAAAGWFYTTAGARAGLPPRAGAPFAT
ncbi:hypothetical protein DM77_1717 [Burkholderia mallei]|nr:hypothetical protein DM77_1717 [Burkholderia mallei]